MYLNKELDYLKISIHTPAKGVTQGLNIPICQTSHYFNPHSREGSDFMHFRINDRSIHFQSTLPWREWRGVILVEKFTTKFSIHTPVKGVTFGIVSTLLLRGVFNPHSREGSDFMHFRINDRSIHFQSTLPWREWRGVILVEKFTTKFSIHTPVKGVTFGIVSTLLLRGVFNPHSREGSD